MKLHKEFLITAMLLVCLTLVLTATALAAPEATTLDWSVIAGGGSHYEAGIYSLDATIGQPVVGAFTNASLEGCSGFWCGLLSDFREYLPAIMNALTVGL